MYEDTQKTDVSYKKITDWANEPTLASLKSDLEQARPHHDAQVLKIKEWQDLLDIKGKAKPKSIKGHSSVQPRLIRRQAEWRYPDLSEPFLSANKIFSINPRTFEDVEAARQNELVINWQFSTKIDKVKFIDDLVRSVVDEGTAIVRLGWERVIKQKMEEAPVFQYTPVFDPAYQQQIQQAILIKESNPRQFNENISPDIQEAVSYFEETGQLVMAQQIGTEQVSVDDVVENKPTVEVVNPTNIYIDPTCNGDFDKALFVIMSFETNKAEKQKTGRYVNLDKVDWEGNTVITEPNHETNTPDTFNFNDETRKKVIAYEYWGFYDIHKTGELVPFVATWIGNVMIRMEENPFPDEKLPFVVVNYLPKKRDLYGEPDAEVLGDHQRIIGAITRGLVDSLGRSANAQQGFAKGMLDPLNRRRFENGEDYEFNPAMNPMQGYIEHKFPELPVTAINMLQIQNQEAEALTGVKSFSEGLSSTAYGEVARGMSGVMDASAKRSMSILRRLAKAMVKIGNKIVAMNYVFLSEEETIRITNMNFITIRREDLKGNFDLDVDISTADMDNMKAQDLGFMFQTLGPNMDPKISMMILSKIADLKRIPDLAQQLREYEPQPDPLEVQAKQLEIQKLQLEIKKLESDILYNQARAQKAMSEADGKDIDNYQTASGIKHSNEMDKQQAQARANQDLEITKALVKPRKEGEGLPDIEAGIGYNTMTDLINQRK